MLKPRQVRVVWNVSDHPLLVVPLWRIKIPGTSSIALCVLPVTWPTDGATSCNAWPCLFLSSFKLFMHLILCHLCLILTLLLKCSAFSPACFLPWQSTKTSASEGILLLFHAGQFPPHLSCCVCNISQLSLALKQWLLLYIFTQCFSFILDQSQRKRLPFSGIIPYAQAPKGFHLF